MKRVFSMPLRALQGFINSIFRLVHVQLSCPHYTSISRRAKQVEFLFKTKTRGAIQRLAIDAIGLNVYVEGEWRVKKNEIDDKRRVWRKLYVVVETSTHESIVAELSLSTLTDGEVLLNLLKQIRLSILEVSGDGPYDMRACHAAIKVKGAIALVLPREGGGLSGNVVTLEISPWVARSYAAQISIGKSDMDTTNFYSQKQRCIELNSC